MSATTDPCGASAPAIAANEESMGAHPLPDARAEDHRMIAPARDLAPGREVAPGKEIVTVLIADDDLTNTRLADRWLSSSGFYCLTAHSAAETLELVHDRRPDLLLLDVMMPDMDGYTLYHLLLQDPELARIPVIFVTAYDGPEDRVRGLRMGAVDYVSKPYHGEELVARVMAALRTKDERDALEERARRLEEQSVRDAVTGLYNRRLLNERLSQELLRAERHGLVLSCLMIDIDCFKLVNDTLGHSAGDDVLRQVAFLISRCARGSDIVARYGGEEFAVILPQTGSRDAYEVGERIRRRVAEWPAGQGQDRRPVTVSIGVAAFPGSGVEDAESLLDAADQALLRAKAAGKNRTVLAEPSAPRPPAPLVVRPRVLIVEDDPNNQALLQKILSRLSYEWVCVSSGQESVMEAAAQAYALILMDLSLPGIDGWEATRRIRDSGSDVPIVATTAHAMPADRVRGFDAGCTEYLTKPFNLTELRRVLDTYAPQPEPVNS